MKSLLSTAIIIQAPMVESHKFEVKKRHDNVVKGYTVGHNATVCNGLLIFFFVEGSRSFSRSN